MDTAETMDPKIWAAIITAGVSLIVAAAGFLVTRMNQKDLEHLKADLSERTAARNAKLEYEFEARKRLYQDCGPLLFQLSEFAERALGRITGLARTAADGDLDPGRSWLDRGYYSLSTYYRLIAPLSVGKLLRKQLTHLDLSLDPAIHWQYTLVRRLADSFTDDFDLAGSKYGSVTINESDWIEYEPHNDDSEKLKLQNSATYWQQGIPRGILDNAVSALIIRDADGTERVMDFREFEHEREHEAPVRESFERIAYLFDKFHPRTRPVLWRVLIAQAHLYRAVLVARLSDTLDPELWSHPWELDKPPDFDWRSQHEQDSIPEDTISTAVKIGMDYAHQTTSPVLARLAENSGEKQPPA